MKAVVLAGGKGARLAPYTKILPKPLMPIGDMPILEVILRQMKIAGIDEVVLTVGHLSELMRAFFQNGEQFGLKISYSYELLRFHKEQNAAATIAAHQRDVKIDLGVIQWDGKPMISGYVEKPTYDYCVSMGVYVFDPRVIKYIPRGEYLDFPDLVRKLINAGEKVVGYAFDGYWQDLGRPDDYERAMLDFEKMHSEFLPEEATNELANPII